MHINQRALRFHGLFVAHGKMKIGVGGRSSERIFGEVMAGMYGIGNSQRAKGTAAIEERDQMNSWIFSYQKKKVYIFCYDGMLFNNSSAGGYCDG